jgi:putative flippase GtrA
MIKFIKVQAGSIIGSIADYITTIILVELFSCWYIFANLSGNIIGGTIQFILSRNWVFKENKGNTLSLVTKFVIFFLGNLILSSIGIYIFTHSLRINYLVSKTVTSVILGISYNYIVQKTFVFN